MKIAIFTDTFLPHTNGVVTSVISLSKRLAERGHKIYIICPKLKESLEFNYKNVKVIRVSSMPALFYEGFRLTNIFSLKIFNFLKKEKIDLIHFHTPMPLGMQAIIISKKLGIPLVGTFHTLFVNPQYLKHARMNFKIVEDLAWIYAKFYYEKCNLITCPSNVIKDDLIKKNIGDEIRVISNGINLQEFDNSDWRKVREKYLGKNKKGKLLLYVGRIAYEKSLPYLLECFKIILEKKPEIKLLLVGGGPQIKDIKQKIHDLNLSDNVILTGEIAHENLLKSSLFWASDLFVTVSTTETQGINLLEAQSNGLVCVAVNEGGVKNIIKNNYNGILVEEGDRKSFINSVIKLLYDDKLREKMKKNTLNEIKKHDMNKIVNLWEKEYLRLIQNKKFNNKSKK